MALTIKRSAVAVLAMALWLLALVLPLPAFAQDPDSGTQGEGELAVSAEGDAAYEQGASFALEGFSRAQVGSSAPVGGKSYGYHFLAGADPSQISLIATEGLVVVHVPEDAAVSFGIDVSDPGDTATLQACLDALDRANANGGALIALEDEWVFTGEDSVQIDGVVFSFGRELKEGFFYDTVEGADGSDATDPANPVYVDITHACFASAVDPGQAQIAEEPSAIDKCLSFLKTVNFSPLWVTLKTSLTAIVIVFVLGLLAAWWSLRCPPRVRDVADAIFTIPMVLPPTVCGFLLLLLLGKNTPVGSWFIEVGFPLVFSWVSTVIAAVVVSFPLMYRSARGAFESLDPNMLDAARTLGWSDARIFFRLMLPLSWSSIAAGTVLAFARALGEFGATLFLAGNYLGITRTIPIAIYFEWMNGNTGVALFWTAVILVFSFAVILFINLWGRRATGYRKGANGR
ncbi:MAG: molybdate ABC transporter permease subunit [Eggerthellaceae bacterium]